MIDVSGQRFNDLIALSRVSNSRAGQMRWLCRCDCGNNVEVSGFNLRTGNSKSCGCRKNKPSKNSFDLKGKKIGFLTVQKRHSLRNGVLHWKCLCICGSTCIVTSSALRYRKTRSCGCSSALLARTDPASHQHGWANRVKVNQGECLKCSETEKLHAHHIVARNVRPEIAKDYSNGITLCSVCHKEFHARYGKQQCDTSELSEFLGLNELRAATLEAFVGHRFKGGRQDLEKAIHYLQLLLQMEYPDV